MSDSPGQGGVVIERGREQKKSVILEVPWALQATEAFDCLWDKTNASQHDGSMQDELILYCSQGLGSHRMDSCTKQALCGLGS